MTTTTNETKMLERKNALRKFRNAEQLTFSEEVALLAHVDALAESRAELLAALKVFADAAQGFDIEFADEDAEAEAESALADARAAIAKAEGHLS